LAFGAIPLNEWIWSLTVEWKLDAIQDWWFGRPWPGGLRLAVLPLLFAIAAGHLVARVHPDKSMAMVTALLGTIVLAAAMPHIVWAERALGEDSSSSALGIVFIGYVQVWASFSGVGVLVGGLSLRAIEKGTCR
jgi:hypothetical protein